jgi:N-acetylmuramoyl-L-alanine amidase
MKPIEPGETCVVSRDIMIEGRVAFSRGEMVTVEKVVPNVERPAYKYVTPSRSLGIRYQLSDADVLGLEAFQAQERQLSVGGLAGVAPPQKPPRAILAAIAILAGMVLVTVIGIGVILALVHGGSRTSGVNNSVLVCLDPGHGGSDTGALENGVAEKDVNLDIALRARKLLESSGYRVVMTRETDRAVSLAERVAAANNAHASVLVSIHNNARPPDAAGTTTYCHRGSPAGRRLALDVQREVVSSAGRPDRGIKESNLYVVRNAIMPAALLESVFLTDRSEAALSTLPSFRQKIAEGTAAGIEAFLKGEQAP